MPTCSTSLMLESNIPTRPLAGCLFYIPEPYFLTHRGFFFDPPGDTWPKQHKYAKYTQKTTNSDRQLANLLVSLADHPRSCPKSPAPAAVDARPGFLSIRPNQPSQPAPNAPVRSTWLPFLLPDLPCHTLDRPPCQLPNRAGPTCIAPDTRPKLAFPSFFDRRGSMCFDHLLRQPIKVVGPYIYIYIYIYMRFARNPYITWF